MCTYLAKRGATYYFRRVIPVELRPTLGGKAEFMLSLRTKDREQAKRLIPAKTAATDALLDQARAQAGQKSPAEAAQINSPAATAYESAMMENSLEAAEIAFREMAEKEERYKSRAAIRERLERTLRKSTAEITPEEAAWRDLLREARDGLTDGQRAEAEAAVVRAEQRRGHLSAHIQRQGKTVPLLETFDAYAKEQGLKPSTAYEWRKNIDALIRFLGHDDARATALTCGHLER